MCSINTSRHEKAITFAARLKLNRMPIEVQNNRVEEPDQSVKS